MYVGASNKIQINVQKPNSTNLQGCVSCIRILYMLDPIPFDINSFVNMIGHACTATARKLTNTPMPGAKKKGQIKRANKSSSPVQNSSGPDVGPTAPD